MIHEKGPVDAGCIGSGSIVVVHEDVPNLDATAAGDVILVANTCYLPGFSVKSFQIS